MSSAFDDSVFHLDTALDATGDAHIRITGDLDWDSADELTEAARALLRADPAPRRLRLDCARLTLCDSLGLASLLMVHRACGEAGTPLHLDNRPEVLRRLLDLTGTAELFDGSAGRAADAPDASGEAGAAPPPAPPGRT
ncbi:MULTISPECIES: STAS domain-containing protein [Streptomyces]|jgi:anti-anti-sigma factor|uniref:STAS domain-containing protein n=1 Tax=Streptomyces TaxID=1883 RepID=UPI000E1CAF57|nr:STAS domain-containing protein [Streptomyces sp. M7]RDS66310.1 anti-sigma factor antagonist [Streptomyces sp. M7]